MGVPRMMVKYTSHITSKTFNFLLSLAYTLHIATRQPIIVPMIAAPIVISIVFLRPFKYKSHLPLAIIFV